MDGSSTGRCYKTMLIKSYINYSLQFLMVFFFRCCFFCCREFWMEYFFVDFFNALCIYIYTHHFFWVAAIHSRRSWDTGGDVFSMYCHSKNDLSKRCSMFGIQQHPPSQPAFSSYSSVPPKNMSFSCIYIYIYKSHVRLYHTALKRCKRCNWPSLCPRPLLECWGITRVVDLSRKNWALGDNRSGLSR